MKWVKTFAWVTLASCCFPRAIPHDPDRAANSAIAFAKVAFVQQDHEAGYARLSENTRKTVSLSEYKKTMKSIHPDLFPLTVTAEEYEPMPGQPAMTIYLKGENGSEEFFYRLIMEGTSLSGYSVSGFLRGNGPYPESGLRQKLKTPPST